MGVQKGIMKSMLGVARGGRGRGGARAVGNLPGNVFSFSSQTPSGKDSGLDQARDHHTSLDMS